MSSPELKEAPKPNISAKKLTASSPLLRSNYVIVSYDNNVNTSFSNSYHILNVNNTSMLSRYSWSFLIGYIRENVSCWFKNWPRQQLPCRLQCHLLTNLIIMFLLLVMKSDRRTIVSASWLSCYWLLGLLVPTCR